MIQRSAAEIRNELKNLEKPELIKLLTQLISSKKENKEYINYLLFYSNDSNESIESFKNSIQSEFELIPSLDKFYAKKSIRKILRQTVRYVKYCNNTEHAIELLLCFCKAYKSKGVNSSKNQVLQNMYVMQLQKAQKLLKSLHEDLQYDYQREIDSLQLS